MTSLFEAGHTTVILDACNTKKARRSQWINKKWTCMFCVMKTTANECRDRAKKISGDAHDDQTFWIPLTGWNMNTSL